MVHLGSNDAVSDPKFDYITIGAGTAGALLANRLSADVKCRVLLIEAGPRDNYHWIHIPVGYLYCIGNPRTDWLYNTEPEAGLNGRALRYPRGKTLGGCSSINGRIYMRGQSRDYDHCNQCRPPALEVAIAVWSCAVILQPELASTALRKSLCAEHPQLSVALVSAVVRTLRQFGRGDDFGISCAISPTAGALGQIDGKGFGQWNLDAHYAFSEGWSASLGIHNLFTLMHMPLSFGMSIGFQEDPRRCRRCSRTSARAVHGALHDLQTIRAPKPLKPRKARMAWPPRTSIWKYHCTTARSYNDASPQYWQSLDGSLPRIAYSEQLIFKR